MAQSLPICIPFLGLVTQKDISQRMYLPSLLQDRCGYMRGGRMLQPCRQQTDSSVRAALAFAHSLRLVHACQVYGDASIRWLGFTAHLLAS